MDDTGASVLLWLVVFWHFPGRKILNDLSSDVSSVPRIEEEKSEDDSTPAITTVTMPTPIYQTSSGQYSEYFWTVIREAGAFS